MTGPHHVVSKWGGRLVEHPQAIQYAFAVSLMQLALYLESPLVAVYGGTHLVGVALWHTAIKGGPDE